MNLPALDAARFAGARRTPRRAGARLAALAAACSPLVAASAQSAPRRGRPSRSVSSRRSTPAARSTCSTGSSPRSSSQRLGQQVFVDPIPGANTIKGADVVAKAPPDGYTFMITTMSTHVNNTVLFTKLPFDPVKDFAPITQVSLGSVLLTAPARAPYSDLKGFVAWAKAQNRPISYGSWGVGSSANVYGEILAKDHGVSLTHVPYKGEQPAIADVIGGNLDVTFASPVGAKPQVHGRQAEGARHDRAGALGGDGRRADVRRAGLQGLRAADLGRRLRAGGNAEGRSSIACRRRSRPSSTCPT